MGTALVILLLLHLVAGPVRAEVVREESHYGANAPRDAESYEASVSAILQRLYTAVERAYERVGVSKEDVQRLFLTQAPPQKLMGKWKAYQDAWPEIAKAREAAIEEMASLGPGAVLILLRATDESDERRGGDLFVFAITKIGTPAVPALIDGLSREEPLVRTRAATSLGRIGDKRAVEPLIGVLDDTQPGVLRAAVWSLGRLADRRAVEPLLDLWNQQGGADKSGLAWALGHIGDRRAVEPIMVELEACVRRAQQEENWDRNDWAMHSYAGALGQIGDPRAVPLLRETLAAGPQQTKVGTPIYLVAEAAADALRSLGVEVEGDRIKGGYRVVESVQETRCGGVQDGRVAPPATAAIGPKRRDYKAAQRIAQPIELWAVKIYGCGGNPRTWQAVQTDAKRQYPITLLWPLIQEASRYVVQVKGVRGCRPTVSYETQTNFLRLDRTDIAPGRYQWSVSVYGDHGEFLDEVETIDPVEIFAIEDPDPVRPNGRKVLIDLNHSAGHVRGWGFYNHSQYMTKELLEQAGFAVKVNTRDLLTAEKLRSVDLLICHYYWTGWPGFRPYLPSELVAVRDFVADGGSLLVVGCDRQDGGGEMVEAANGLVNEFGFSFELAERAEQHGWAEIPADQNIICFDARVQMQLPVRVRGEDATTLVEFGGSPIVMASPCGEGKVIAAGVGMSFLDCYLGDFERREPLHLLMFCDFIKHLTGVDWRQTAKREFVDAVLSRTRLAGTGRL
jgi:hypothetical protein